MARKPSRRFDNCSSIGSFSNSRRIRSMSSAQVTSAMLGSPSELDDPCQGAPRPLLDQVMIRQLAYRALTRHLSTSYFTGQLLKSLMKMVGVAGFEPTTPSPPD